MRGDYREYFIWKSNILTTVWWAGLTVGAELIGRAEVILKQATWRERERARERERERERELPQRNNPSIFIEHLLSKHTEHHQ